MFTRTIQRYGDTTPADTPHQKAGQIWDSRIGAAVVQARNWRLMALGEGVIIFVLVGGLIWLSSQSRLVPYVVEVDKLGDVQSVGPAVQAFQPSDAIIGRDLGNLIWNIRTLTIDPVMLVHHWDLAYAFLTDRAKAQLNDYERAHDPSKALGHHTVEVQITSVTRVSDTSFQVKWIERHVDDDTAASDEHWTAILTYVRGTPKADQFNANPLGIFVDGINWSRELEPDKSLGG